MKRWNGILGGYLNAGLILVCVFVIHTIIGCAGAEGRAARRIDFGPSAPGTLKIMTFNIRFGTAGDGPNSWPERKSAFFDQIADLRADVIGMQEVLDFQLQEIRRAFRQYAAVSTGRDDGKSAGEASSILYRKDRFTLEDSGTFWFSNTPWEPASTHWGNTIPRICTWARLTEKANGSSFYVYNLHLDHQSQPSREKSVRLLAKEIAARQFNDPYLVMGDFNVTLNNPAMLYLQKIGFSTPYPKLTDTWQLARPERPAPGTFNGFEGKTDGGKIDHILVPDNVRVLSADVDTRTFDGRNTSDHFPVIAVVQIGDWEATGP
jgi:endonuclease/exonuclease/phosphatase family metal-dependent hydrolase